MVFVARLVIAMIHVVFLLRNAPGFIVALELDSLIHGERRNSDTSQAEVIGAVVVPGFGKGISADLKAEVSRSRKDYPIECGPLCARNFHLLGCPKRLDVVVVKVERNFASRDRRMLPQVFRTEQPLLFGSD